MSYLYSSLLVLGTAAASAAEELLGYEGAFAGADFRSAPHCGTSIASRRFSVEVVMVQLWDEATDEWASTRALHRKQEPQTQITAGGKRTNRQRSFARQFTRRVRTATRQDRARVLRAGQ